MKKLLGVFGILVLGTALLPVQGHADLRGAFAPLTIASGLISVNGCEQGAFRPGNTIAVDAGTQTYERWFALSTRSLVPGFEAVRSIYQHRDAQQSGDFVALLDDPSVQTSYADPAWSFDGKYLAYSQLNSGSTASDIYVQEYAFSNSSGAASVAIGAPILAVAGTPGVTPRHPDWSPNANYTLVFDSNAAGLSIDLYTVDVFPVGVPVRRTFANTKAEFNAQWSPNGHDIAFVSNQFGPTVLQILDLNLASNDPGYIRLAETNFGFVSHNNPSYTSDGNGLMYDAPTGEDPAGVTDVWLLDLPTQTKCEIQFDNRSDSDPDVSGIVNNSQVTHPGDVSFPYNGFIFTSQGGNFGVDIWRATPVNSCLAPLPMGVVMDPTVININPYHTDPDGNPLPGGNQQSLQAILSFPAETQAAGYSMTFGNSPTEGVRCRSSIIASPTLLGLPVRARAAEANPFTGIECFDEVDVNGELSMRCSWNRRVIVDRILALGLAEELVPMKVTAYSNRFGRQFQGFGYLKVTKAGLGGSSVSLLGNSPNPFNPVTTIKFAVNKPGNVTLRIFDVRGALVKTLAKGHYDVGVHEATWDGRTSNGNKASSGVYYSKITGADNETDSKRLVMAK